MNVNIFVFLYEQLNLGGIETNLIYMIKAYHKMGIRIIWLRYGDKNEIYDPWKQVLLDNSVEIIDCTVSLDVFFECPKIHICENEVIFGLTFDPFDFVRLTEYLNSYNNIKHIFYQVPHFKRDLNYPEEYYSSLFRKHKIKQLSPIFQKLYNNGNLLFFAKRHQEEIRNRYNVDCVHDNGSIYVAPIEIQPFDEALAKKKAERNPFIILTCGRFDFPHKAYVFGLVDAFCELKKQYPNIVLEIVGYGLGESEIKKYVDEVDENYKKDIIFHGAVSPDEMSEFYKRASVNVSVAGAIVDGARIGCLSLPARHYSYNCEVYGWYNPKNSNILHNEDGEPVIQYLKKIIEMGNEQYIELCKDSYDTVASNSVNLNWLFEKTNKQECVLSNEDISIIKNIYRFACTKRKIRLFLKAFLSRLGLLKICRKIDGQIRIRKELE